MYIDEDVPVVDGSRKPQKLGRRYIPHCQLCSGCDVMYLLET